MGKGSAPAPPDYSGVAAASEASAKYAYAMGQDQLAWAKDQYGQDKAVTDRVVNAALDRQGVNDTNAAADRARYEQSYQPLEDDLIRDARDFSSPERQRAAMGRAEATVAQQFEGQRQAALQQLEGFGVDPSSTRYAALDSGARIAQAAAAAAAGNTAQQQTEAQGRALRSEAINVGRGYPGQIAQTYGTALMSGNQGANSQLAQTASGANTMGTGMGWQGAGNQAIGTWGNTLNMGYSNQLAQYNANQQSSSGIGSALGLVGALIPSFSEGGEVPGGGAIPTGENPGSAVPIHASPSGGSAIDDVPARLTPGEYVVPRDAVSWKGEEFFQKLIEKSRQDRQQATAKPKMASVPQQAPTFASAQPGAIPVG